MDFKYRPSLSASRIALLYLLLGGGWILLSDRLVAAVVPAASRTLVQTTKGWLFVGGSAAVIYALVDRRERELAHANERLERAVEQASVLHRILRHNLRNACVVIRGNLDLLADRHGETAEIEAIRGQSERLVEMSRTSSELREFVDAEPPAPSTVDVVALCEDALAAVREEHPDASIETDFPETAWARTYGQFSGAVAELLRNAIEHGSADDPGAVGSAPDNTSTAPVSVRVSEGDDGRLRVVVTDRGPGLPEVERELLEAGVERPMRHSQGLGLWFVRTVVAESGGEISIAEDGSAGTVVAVTLPAAAPPERTAGS
ncbi:MAG: sensor histidine kinase [Haloarculaceae archaeon]